MSVLNFNRLSSSIPTEIIQLIIKCLPPKLSFKLSTIFRFPYVQEHAFKNLPKPKGNFLTNLVFLRKYHALNLAKYLDHEVYREEWCSILRSSCALGDVAFLEWWGNSGIKVISNYDVEQFIEYASKAGKVDVLDWWRNSEYEFVYGHRALLYASAFDSINVLQWWKQSGLEIRFENSPDFASALIKNLDVLNWWVDTGLEITLFNCFYLASQNGDDKILERLVELQWPLLMLEENYNDRVYPMDIASSRGHVHVLQWWKDAASKYGLELRWSARAMVNASRNDRLRVLDWWAGSGLDLKFEHPVYRSTAFHRFRVMDWWANSGLILDWVNECGDIIDLCSKESDIASLNWWKKLSDTKDVKLKWTNVSLEVASLQGNTEILNWWKDSGWEMKFDRGRIVDLSDPVALEWWKDYGLIKFE
ncbi:hypothetical protein HK098_006911 [Nowakowskiella sp. JEL0407]|nr:hypothetical protein HK098_006911 [Nowakowskiella sp. JEL0407]